MKNEFFFSFPASLETSPAVRRIAEDIFQRIPLSKQGQGHLKLVFSEVLMNAVKHGSNEAGLITIQFTIAPDKIRVVTEDEGQDGKRINADQLRDIVAFQEKNDVLTKTSGRGLAQIVKKWADYFEVDNSPLGGITVVFEKNFENDNEEGKGQSGVEGQEGAKNFEEVIFAFDGTIDEVNIQEKGRRIEEFFAHYPKEPKNIVLDFENLDFFLSIFIGRIVEWKRIAKEKGGDLRIINISPDLFDILDLTGITHIVNISRKKIA